MAFDRVWDVSWSRNPAEVKDVRALVRGIARLVAEHQYDIVHVHTPVAAFVTRFALRKLRRTSHLRIIYTAHGFHFYRGGHPLRNRVFLTLEKLAGRWTDYLVVINREDEEAAKRLGVIDAGRVRYMPGIGIDTERYSPGRVSEEAVSTVRRELGLGLGDELVLMIAEFNPGKRHADALRALAAVPFPTTHLAFAGEGPLMSDVRGLAAELGLERRVHFLGFREDIPALIRAARVVLLPSEREGLPRSIMEALSLEVPVIATDIRGVRELVDFNCGILIPPGDVAALACAMERVLSDPRSAREMGRQGRRKMEAFDLKNVLAMHEALYRDALSG